MKVLRAFLAAGCALSWVGHASGELADGIEAVVHDSVITMYEVQALNAQTAAELRRDYANQPAVFAQKAAAVRTNNLEMLMGNQLILKEFSSAGYNLPESVIDDVVHDRIRAEFGDRKTMAKTLDARGMTSEKYRQQVKEQFIIRAMREKNVAQEIIISPHKVQNYYNNHKEDYRVKDQARIRTIVVPKTDDRDSRQLADEILSKLKEGAAFEEMANLNSQGAPRKDGGDMGWREISGLRKELADAVSQLNAGERSGIVDTPDAYYLVLVEEKKEAHYRPLSEVRDEIEQNLSIEERARLNKQWIERLKKKTFYGYRPVP